MMPRKGDYAHGVTEREQMILDRDEAGEDHGAIATDMGVARSYVTHITKLYDGSWRANIAFEAMVRQGTKALERACVASGGRFL